jgi:hypothetical protein
MLHRPFRVAALCPRNVRLQHVSNLGVARIMNGHTLFFVAIRALESLNPDVQSIAFFDLVDVLGMDITAASFMSHFGLLHDCPQIINLLFVGVAGSCALVPALVQLTDRVLVIGMLGRQCPLDVTKQEFFDSLQGI